MRFLQVKGTPTVFGLCALLLLLWLLLLSDIAVADVVIVVNGHAVCSL